MDTTALIIAISGLIAGLIAGIIGWNNSKSTIKRDELSEIRKELGRLQDRIECLEIENETWRLKYNELYEYVMVLRGTMLSGNMPVPPMPVFEETEIGKKRDKIKQQAKKEREKN